MNATAVAENIIDRDREYDQTARTETPGPRTVSPAILEHRIQILERENRDLTERLRVATERIAGFEALCSSLSQKLNSFESDLAAAFCNAPGPYGGFCVLSKNHEGPCRSLAFLTRKHL